MASEKKLKVLAQVLGRMLQSLRIDSDLTQEIVAQKLGLSGPWMISRIETGSRDIKLWQFIEACKLYAKDAREVLDQLLKKIR